MKIYNLFHYQQKVFATFLLVRTYLYSVLLSFFELFLFPPLYLLPSRMYDECFFAFLVFRLLFETRQSWKSFLLLCV